MVVNMLAYLFTPDGLGLRAGGAWAVIFSLICIVVASMNLVMDFDFIEERHPARGAPQQLAWYAAFGLTVTLVWLYIEILRLLGYFFRAAFFAESVIGCPVFQRAYDSRSRIIAMPWPPPTHMVSRPNCLSCHCSELISVVVIRAPVMPNGWPTAIAPPLTLSRSRSMPSSR